MVQAGTLHGPAVFIGSVPILPVTSFGLAYLVFKMQKWEGFIINLILALKPLK